MGKRAFLKLFLYKFKFELELGLGGALGVDVDGIGVFDATVSLIFSNYEAYLFKKFGKILSSYVIVYFDEDVSQVNIPHGIVFAIESIESEICQGFLLFIL